jgi:hypothetical protein
MKQPGNAWQSAPGRDCTMSTIPNVAGGDNRPLAPPWGVDWALYVANQGWRVFPIRPGIKEPYSRVTTAAALGIDPAAPAGLHHARSDEPSIRALWGGERADAWIGLATGNGRLAIDIDEKEGASGNATIAANGWTIPATAWQRTPSGGAHLIVTVPPGINAPTDTGVLGSGLDRRGDGGYIVLYDPALITAPIAPAPEWSLTNAGRSGERRSPLGTDRAPSFDLACKALRSIDPDQLDYDHWRNVTAAYRHAATGTAHDDAIRSDWDGWCATYATNDIGKNNKLWRSLDNGTGLGWDFLRQYALKHGDLPDDDRARLAGLNGAAHSMPMVPNANASPVDFWATFNADEAAKASAIACIKHLAELGWPVAHNEFSDRTMITARVPWDDATATHPREWTDNDTHGCKAALEATFIKPSKETVHDTVRFIALRNKYHPVRDYLNGLRWDGIMRLPALASRYFGAEHTPYSELIGTKFMISAVARIKEPGCKADTMLILEGAQGAGKSSALRSLVGDDWFTDQMPDFSTKDAEIQLGGKWLIEIAELDRMNRAEVTAVKSYASRQIGTYRPPYGRATINVPRQCIFAGSTNETEYLRDQTGNRRFWPITCGRIDGAAIRRDRDQLWAEAVFRYQLGERWWLEGDQERLAQAEQDGRRERDPWEELIASRLAIYGTMPITIEQVCLTVLGITFEKHNATINRRVATCLKRAGYTRRQIRFGEDRGWRYVKD